MLQKFNSVYGKLSGIGLPNNNTLVLSCAVRLCFKMAGKRDLAFERTCMEYIIADIYIGKGFCLGCVISDLING